MDNVEKDYNGKKPYTAQIGNIKIEEWNYEIFLTKIAEAKNKVTENKEENKEYLRG